ncbi:translocation/assembly module TamB domain-containing protein [Rhizobium sp. TRM95111]|uniref:translocation/assembly module TamB domain-containing protein n=1 Tax=Rhizobium alarense TaxID=2846851 RepID=UPI001F260CFA|nr:translocation/assembly module TamB domain-containing protein [Rhizobium alarense]MCF3639421.1 translocation/assembly module TamB domain-containing protein [Rhizobium alarense]
MNRLLRIIRITLRYALFALFLLLVALAGLVGYVGFTDSGARLAAGIAEDLLSGPDQTIVIGAPSGLLTGRLRVGSVTVGDAEGPYAEVEDLALDWSPLDLLFFEFNAERLAAGSIDLARLPTTAASSTSESGEPFSLPVSVNVEAVDIPELSIGAPVLGREQRLAVTGSATARPDDLAAKLIVADRERLQARIAADLAFAPSRNELKLDADIDEPPGGLIATLLRLPGEPALSLRLAGEGPLSGWHGRLEAAVDGQQVLALEGRHALSIEGLHSVALTGGGEIATLLPPELRPLFAGNTAIDLVAGFGGEDLLRIEHGTVTTEAIALDASGRVSASGENTLQARLAGRSGPIDFRWPLAGGEMQAVIEQAELTLQGPANAAALDLQLSVPSLELPQGTVQAIRLTARSDAFDVGTGSGPITVAASTGTTSFVDPNLDRLIRGPAKITADLTVSPQNIALSPVALESASIGGTATGTYDRQPGTADLAFRLFALPAVLPDEIARNFTKTIALEGRLATTQDGGIALAGLSLTSDAGSASGTVTLADNAIDVDLAGSLTDIAKLADAASGSATFELTAEGPLDGPKVTARVAIPEARFGARTINEVALTLDGTASLAAPSGTLGLDATVNGKAVTIRSQVTSADGRISVPVVEISAGSNRANGSLALGDGFLPEGEIAFTFPDLAFLAAMAGEDASGDLAGTITFHNENGKGSAVLAAEGAAVARDTLRIEHPRLSVAMDDLKVLRAEGEFRADVLVAGENTVETPVVSFSHQGGMTSFDISGRYEDAPLATEGTVSQLQGGTVVGLKALQATVGGYGLALDEPASVALRDGAVVFDRLALDAGFATLQVAGSFAAAGESDVTARLVHEAGQTEFVLAGNAGVRALVDSAELTLNGTMENARLNLTAQLSSATVPQAELRDITLTATSPAFDLLQRRGSLSIAAGVEQSGFDNADLTRLLAGPLRLVSSVAVSSDDIRFADTALDGAGIDAQVTGNFAPPTGAAQAEFIVTAAKAALPAAVAGRVDTDVVLAGSVTRSSDGTVNLSDVTVTSGTAEAQIAAKLSGNQLEGTVDGTVLSLGRLLADAEGRATFNLSASGPLDGLDVKGRVESSGATLAGRTLSDLVINLEGKAIADSPSGQVTATGALDGQAINVRTRVQSAGGRIAVPDIAAEIGSNRLNGALALDGAFLPSGNLTFDFPDVGLLAAMAGQKADGDLTGSVAIDSTDGKTSIALKATGSGIRRDDFRIANPDIDLRIGDLATLDLSGTAKIDSITVGENRLRTLNATFDRRGGTTNFDVNGRYDDAPLVVSGALEQAGDALTVDVHRFEAAPRKVAIRLAQPTRFRIAGGGVALDGLTIGAGRGSVVVNGTAGEALNLTARITALPAGLANSISPGLGAEGTISGTVTIKGTGGAPVAGYDLTWDSAQLAQTKAAGVGALTIRASGDFANNKVNVSTRLTGAGGLSFEGGGTLGTAGTMPIAMKARGTLPFSLLGAQLAAQGFTLTGNAAVDLSISGTATKPSITGTVSTSGARLVDVRRNLAVENLTARVSLDGRQAVIQQATGNLASGGQLSVTGRVGIEPGSGFPADIAIRLADLTYVDGTLVTARLTGDIKVTGPLAGGPTLGGTIRISRANITVPEKLPASLSEIQIKHRNAPADVQRMAADLKRDKGGDGTASGIALDLVIDAPGQIFVRGRGINAELGGRLTIRGTSSAPNISGGFDLRRGRLEILAKRLDFTSGNIGFAGGLVPTVNLVAGTTSGSTSITITVSGLANNPNVAFASSPALPQDEILAQLIFNRSMSNLSAVQIAQLAAAVSQLAGGRSTGLLDGLRSKLGVDDLDITTDSEGRAQVSAGKYLNDRTYLELKQDAENGGGKAVINLDIGRGVKLRGEAGSNGAGAAGIFYEKEY